jgi:hypothetical protein
MYKTLRRGRIVIVVSSQVLASEIQSRHSCYGLPEPATA